MGWWGLGSEVQQEKHCLKNKYFPFRNNFIYNIFSVEFKNNRLFQGNSLKCLHRKKKIRFGGKISLLLSGQLGVTTNSCVSSELTIGKHASTWRRGRRRKDETRITVCVGEREEENRKYVLCV